MQKLCWSRHTFIGEGEVMGRPVDIAFGEDDSQTRVDDRGEAYTRFLKMALNLLKLEKSFKYSIQRKRMSVAMDEFYLSEVLAAL